MSTRQFLNEVQQEYMSMTLSALIDIAEGMNLDISAALDVASGVPADVTRNSIIDILMAVEERAAFS